MKPKVIAHRGARKVAPENTLEAMKISIDAGVDGIEFDVQRCSTGELVVIHDDQINRTTNGVGYIKDISWAELQRLDAGSWFDPSFSGVRIPSLQQVLDMVSGAVTLNIELKTSPTDYPGIEEDVLALLQGYAKDTIIISSFDHKLMKRLAGLDSTLNLALLAEGIFIDIGNYAAQMNAKYWHPGFSQLRADAVEDAHAAGLKVNTWTLNTPRSYESAIKMGVDGIVSDDPQGLIAYLERTQVASGCA
jgi:glycerophosphoryl diester phosphodiesterase